MPAPRQRALGFVIEGEGNYREPSTELHGRRPFNRAIARRRIHAKLFREILEEHLRLFDFRGGESDGDFAPVVASRIAASIPRSALARRSVAGGSRKSIKISASRSAMA